MTAKRKVKKPMTVKKAITNAAATKRARHLSQWLPLNYFTPETAAEDRARSEARKAAYDFLCKTISRLDVDINIRIEAAKILIGGCY